ncbi:hypothetical protein [Krasilnikovia sp. MM14-A1004]|uniref:hypothetical protein n=1 Tax=Krasilnikovia sp. MM14-A1004 TaxID=3373541 RepID=UPI00399C70B4
MRHQPGKRYRGGMAEWMFIARVAAMLLVAPTAVHRSWSGRRSLQEIIGLHLGADPIVAAAVAAEGSSPRPDLVDGLARAIRRAAEANDEFAQVVREIVVEAYAVPAAMAGLPDPAPSADQD